jgi:hypothetical protein
VVQRTALPALIGLVVLIAGCGGSGNEHCDSAAGARLCVVKAPGGYNIEARHLKPGTEVLAKFGGKPYGPGVPVADDGSLAGHAFGFLGPHLGVISAEAVARNGQRLRVTLDAG